MERSSEADVPGGSAEPTALPWGMERDDMQQSSLASLTDEKLARFVLGQQKKTKFEKEREEREARKRKADAEAAAIYATFVASFEDDDEDTKGKAFVRGGRSREEARDEDVYRLQGTGSSRRREMDRMLEEMKQRTVTSDAVPPRKRRQIDLFLDEIKSREPSAPTRDDSSHVKGSFDDGDPLTTNLYVGNLAPTTTEETLERAFGRFGRIFSIKIMWPRTDEERQRRRNCGFVSFFRRDDADAARVQLNETELDDQTIVVGWGKAVKIDNSAPAFAAAGTTELGDASSTIQVQFPADSLMRERIDRLAQFVVKDGLEFENEIRRRERENPDYRFLFDTTQRTTDALYYRWRVYSLAMGDDLKRWKNSPFQMTEHGTLGESQSELESQHQPPSSKPKSLSKPSASLAFASTQQESKPQLEPQSKPQPSPSPTGSRSRQRHVQRALSPSPRQDRDRELRRPAPVLRKDEKLLTGQQLARARDLERGRGVHRLSRDDVDHLMALLDGVTLERESIKTVMGFALDNSEAAVDIVHLLSEQFDRDDASAVSLVAFLFVVSDILHNSSASVKNASLFRTTFQECLPAIFDRLRRCHKAIVGRMSAIAMRDKVLSVLTAWEQWSLFPPQYLVGLNATFLRKVEEEEFLAQCRAEGTLMSDRATAIDEERLRKTCVQAGIQSSGGVEELLARLQWLREFTAPATKKSNAPVGETLAAAAPSPSSRAMKEKDDKGKQEEEHDDVDGEPIDDDVPTALQTQAEEEDEEDVDGEPLDETDEVVCPTSAADEGEDLDGEPLDDDDEDLDGAPLDEEEDLDGEPV
ncbi:hypothetical protein ATCC90586_005810 [Pythium insidiosum]|nr:hypothetical protein ATCC90586_005810 [Pythium insidiosum]